jgi:hypothetical protein
MSKREFLAQLREGAHGPFVETKPTPSKREFLAQLREGAHGPFFETKPTPSKREMLAQLREGADEPKPTPSKREFLAQLRAWADEPKPTPSKREMLAQLREGADEPKPTPSKREILAQLRAWADEPPSPIPIHQADENDVEDTEHIRPHLSRSSITSVSRMSTSSPIATTILDLEGEIEMKSNKTRMGKNGSSIGFFSEIYLNLLAAISIISFRIIQTIIINDYIYKLSYYFQ